MAASHSPLISLLDWARSDGLEAVLLLAGAALGTRLIRWLGTRAEGRIDENARNADALVRSEQAKHRHAVVQVVTYVALVLVYTVTAVLVLSRLGVPITSLVAPAAVLGVALGFGAQRFVQDLLSGFFVVAEKQYGYGDVIRLSLGGGIAPVTGTVEDVTLRVTQIRTADGEVVITPNGQILQVTNLSRDWARAVVDVPVPADADVGAVTDALVGVGERAFASGRLKPLLLDAPSVMGVESLEREHYNVRVVARTLPGKQFEVGRQLRSQIATTLRKQGVLLAPHLETSDGGR